MNQIAKIFEERGLNVASFARKNGINQNTLYNVLKKDTADNVSISVFMKIAHGLGLTCEELYYYNQEQELSAKSELISNYEALNDIGQNKVVEYSSDLLCSSKYTEKNLQDIPIQRTA